MKYICSISGGQDSTAMTVQLLELGYPVDYIVFCDTGNEFPQMYDYLNRLDKYLQDKYQINITRLKSKNTLESLCFSPFTRGERKGQMRGLPYSSMMSFCTRDLKKNVSDKFCRSLKEDCTMYIGYVAREKRRCHDGDKKYITHKYPLIDWGWNEPEVANYLKDKTLFNILYEHFSRTGCMFCPKQNRESWFSLYAYHRKDWNVAKEWEQRAKENNAVIKTFIQNLPLEILEKRFEKKLKKLTDTPSFSFDWNQEDVSCMCK